MKHKICFAFAVACLLVASALANAQLSFIPGNPVSAVGPGMNTSAELIGRLTKELKVTDEQAAAGAGILFGLAKHRLKPEEFSKLSDAVPGMEGLLAAAPPLRLGGGSLGGITSALPGLVGDLVPVALSFKSLGLSPKMAAKFVPVLTHFVSQKSGDAVAGLLAAALR